MNFVNVGKKVRSLLSVSLYKNSLYLMLTTLFGTGSGFFFWIFAARLYSPDEVGLAVAIISAMCLLSMFSRLGFDIGIIRYLPNTNNKNEMINSCLTIISIASIIFSIIFLVGLNFFSPKLLFLREMNFYSALFIIFTLVNSVLVTQNNIFAALRYSKYSFIQTLIAISRILLLPILVVYGLFGMYFSYGIGISIASIIGNRFISKIHPIYKLKPRLQKDIMKSIFNFSFKNYIATIFEGAPTYILPLLVVHILGAEKNAYFYIAWTCSSFIKMIPRATALSLFAEGSNNNSIKKDTIASIKFIYTLLVPIIILIFIFGRYILQIFGEDYSENAFDLMKIFALSSIPFTLNMIYVTIKRIQNDINPIIYIYLFIAVSTIFSSYLLLGQLGIMGVGISWIVVNSITGIFVVKCIFKLNENTD